MPDTSDPSTRTVGLLGATLVGVSAIVGGGILVLAGAAFRSTGPGALLAFALNGGIALLTALTYAEMSTLFPESGGAYTFAKKVLSIRAAFAVGWVLWFAYIVAGVLYALGFASYALAAVETVWQSASGTAPDWLGSRQASVALALAACAYYALALIRKPAGGGTIETWGKLTVFVVLIVAGLWVLSTSPLKPAMKHLSPFLPEGTTGLIAAMGFTFIALQGFDLVAAIAGEVKHPRRTIPYAMFASLGAALAIYLPLLFVVITVGTTPGSSIAEMSRSEPETVIAVAVRNYLGPVGYWLVLVAAVLSTLSALAANLLAASRVALSMALDRTLPTVIAKAHPKRGTPMLAVYTSALTLAAILLMVPNLASAGAAASLIFLISFALAHGTSVLVRRRAPARQPGFRTPFFPAVPVVGGVCCAGMALFQGIAVPSAGLITLLWLGLGVVLYLALFSSGARTWDALSEARDPLLVRLRGRSPLVLVPIANPSTAPALVAVAHALAARDVGRVLMLSVVAPSAPGREAAESITRAQQVLGEALTETLRTGQRAEALLTVAPAPWAEIVRVARTHRCAGLLLGRAGLAGLAGNDDLESVLNQVDCDVVFMSAPPDWSLNDAGRILVLVGGRGGHHEVRARILGSLCRDAPRQITWLRLLPAEATDAQCEESRKQLRDEAARQTSSEDHIEVVRTDDLAGAVAGLSSDADLLIVGLTRTPDGRRAFGSVVPAIVSEVRTATLLISQGSLR